MDGLTLNYQACLFRMCGCFLSISCIELCWEHSTLYLSVHRVKTIDTIHWYFTVSCLIIMINTICLTMHALYCADIVEVTLFINDHKPRKRTGALRTGDKHVFPPKTNILPRYILSDSISLFHSWSYGWTQELFMGLKYYKKTIKQLATKPKNNRTLLFKYFIKY